MKKIINKNSWHYRLLKWVKEPDHENCYNYYASLTLLLALIACAFSLGMCLIYYAIILPYMTQFANLPTFTYFIWYAALIYAVFKTVKSIFTKVKFKLLQIKIDYQE